jgi:hypothetical protein
MKARPTGSGATPSNHLPPRVAATGQAPRRMVGIA